MYVYIYSSIHDTKEVYMYIINTTHTHKTQHHARHTHTHTTHVCMYNISRYLRFVPCRSRSFLSPIAQASAARWTLRHGAEGPSCCVACQERVKQRAHKIWYYIYTHRWYMIWYAMLWYAVHCTYIYIIIYIHMYRHILYLSKFENQQAWRIQVLCHF